MRLGIVCILLSAATAAFSQDLPSYAAASANPKTVLDYFLLCPSVGDDLGLAGAATVTEEMFEAKKEAIRKGLKNGSVLIDVANAYIRTTGSDDTSNDWVLTFVFFDRKGKS